MDKNIQSWHNSANSSYSNFDYLVDGWNRRKLPSDKTFLVRDSKSYSISIYYTIEDNVLDFTVEDNVLEIDDDGYTFENEPEIVYEPAYKFYLYKNSRYLLKSSYISDIESNWNKKINSCIESYISGKVSNSGESKSTSIITSTNDPLESDYDYLESDYDPLESDYDSDYDNDYDNLESDYDSDYDNDNDNLESDYDPLESDYDNLESSNDNLESSNDNCMQKYKHLWVRCEDCYGLIYKKFLKSKMNICEHCGYHLKMSSSDRIELLIDPGTWNPMDEYMVSVDPIEFHSEEEPYKNRLDSYQKRTGLKEAVQTGTGQLNGIPLAIGIMDFQFMGGSMGSVVGEKITRLIEYATNQRLPLILVCASGGARMQEGSLSLMQMAKISSALYDYQLNQKLFYVPILTSPTTGGVTASFGMLGDIIIAEPNAYIAFAGKRVIEQTLNKEVPEGSQSAEFLFQKGLFDSIVPRNLLKEVLTELFQFHGFVPLTQNEK